MTLDEWMYEEEQRLMNGKESWKEFQENKENRENKAERNDRYEYVKIYCCADCVHYDMKKHRCRNGAKDEGTGREHFYRDCRLGIHNENESVPLSVLQEIRQEITDRYENDGLYFNSLKFALEIIDKHIKEIEE